MNFCENCGKPLRENSKFCENCGTKILKDECSKYTSKTPAIKNKRYSIFAFLAILILIFTSFKLFSSTDSSEGKIKKDEYMKIYNEAIRRTETANFIQAKVELEKLQNTKSFDGINIKKDIDMNVQLFGIQTFVSSKDLKEEDIIEELENKLNKFEKDYKNSNSKIKKASDTFTKESKTFLDLLKTYVQAEKFIDSKDISNAKKELEKLKEYKFTTPRFENMAESKVLNIESGIHIADSQNLKDNDRDVPKTSENSSINNSSNNNGRPSIQDQFNRLKSIIEADFKGTLAVNYSSWHRQGESSLRIELNKGNNTYYGEFSYSANGEWIYVEFSDLSGKNYNSYKA